MKYWISLLLLLAINVVSVDAQDYQEVDNYALEAPRDISKDLPKLTEYLIKDYDLEEEKVRSFYTWIIHNIKYDDSAYKRGRKRINHSNEDVLDRRQAVCLGYCTLMKEMCEISGIEATVVNGYPRNQETLSVDLESANHAWTAVLVEGKWMLLDITWGAGNGRQQLEYFFFSPPEELILTHLPADPMWQLLDCPVPPDVFKKSKNFVKSHLLSSDSCFNFQDSIAAFSKLSSIAKKIKMTENAYRLNPVKQNKQELGHAYIDQINLLIDRASELELTDSMDAIKAIHLQILNLGEIAKTYVELFDHHKENLAYSHINYAIALSRDIQNTKDQKSTLAEMRTHFSSAKTILESLSSTFIIENALSQIDGYLDWVDSY